MSLVTALIVAVLGSLAVEATSPPRPISRKPGDLAIRLGSYALVAVFWFQFTWRPWLACLTCILTLVTTTAVNRLKRKVIGESLVFSDLALIHQVPRHPELYYALPLSDLRAAGMILGGFAGLVLWCLTEPTHLPEGAAAAVAAYLALPLIFVALLVIARAPAMRDRLVARFPCPELERDVLRYGVLATLVAYALRRDTEQRFPRPEPTPPALPEGAGDDLFIVVQLESFLDPERLGCDPLPAMARIRREAVQYGSLRVPAHGAYTMRSEHAVLTGRDREEIGFGQFDPYLAFGGRDASSLPRLAARAGYDTAFVHPYHRDFFGRARIMDRLGFRRLVMLEEFGDAPRIGPYVADAAFAARILAEMRASTGQLFLFGVSMENHGPWKAGRLPGIDDPLAQYRHHLTHSGLALEMLIDGLQGRRATLCVFGDHPPSLPANRPSATAPQTDYAIFRFGHPHAPAPQRIDLDAAGLGRCLRAAMAGQSPWHAG